MTAKTATAPKGSGAGELREIPIGKLFPSKLNPRKIRNKESDAELEASIAKNGVMIPLVARPAGGQFEIVAGARRFAGAEKAKLKTVPVIVRDLNDEQFFDLAVIEFAQREDLHPLDEARAYLKILKRKGCDEKQLAVIVSKPEAYVRVRMKFVDLIEEAAALFESGAFGFDSALMICRLQERDQKTVVKTLSNYHEKDFSTGDIQRVIDREVRRSLERASFSLDDANIYPAAGACVNCPKRSGAIGSLFPEVKEDDQCFDPKCFETKTNAVMKAAIKELEASGKKFAKVSSDWRASDGILPRDKFTRIAGGKTCENAIMVIHAEGVDYGKVEKACITPGCKVHAGAQGSMGGSGRAAPPTPAARFKTRLSNLEAKRDEVRAEALLAEALERIAANQGEFTVEHALVVIGEFFDRLWHDAKKSYCDRRGVEPTKTTHSKDYSSPFLDHCRAVFADGPAWKPFGVYAFFAILTDLSFAGRMMKVDGDVVADVMGFAEHLGVDVPAISEKALAEPDLKIGELKAAEVRRVEKEKKAKAKPEVKTAAPAAVGGKKKKPEELLDCPDCGKGKFTVAGLRAHVCKQKGGK